MLQSENEKKTFLETLRKKKMFLETFYERKIMFLKQNSSPAFNRKLNRF